ncbi:MAG: hypothetical protein WDW38_005987 [Sanguina aurantia]
MRVVGGAAGCSQVDAMPPLPVSSEPDTDAQQAHSSGGRDTSLEHSHLDAGSSSGSSDSGSSSIGRNGGDASHHIRSGRSNSNGSSNDEGGRTAGSETQTATQSDSSGAAAASTMPVSYRRVVGVVELSIMREMELLEHLKKRLPTRAPQRHEQQSHAHTHNGHSNNSDTNISMGTHHSSGSSSSHQDGASHSSSSSSSSSSHDGSSGRDKSDPGRSGGREEGRSAAADSVPPTRYVYLSSMAVASDARRQGVAQALLTGAELQCHLWQVPDLLLHVYKDNSTAVALYQKAGHQVLHKDPSWRAWLGERLRLLMFKRLPDLS